MISKRHQKLVLCLLVGLSGLLASSVPWVLDLEETAGLDWLFLLRGPVPPPDDVVLVSIDSESAAALDQHRRPDRWPRSLHASLIDKLTTAGVAGIVFDLYFVAPGGTTEDRAFAAAARRAGNVVLLERLNTESVTSTDAQPILRIEERTPPIPVLRQAALATAPFPLPVVPIKVSQFWTFGPTNASVLTLPSVALHTYALESHDTFLRLIDSIRPGTVSSFAGRESLSGQASLSILGSRIRELFIEDTDLAREMRARVSQMGRDSGLSEKDRSNLEALVDLYSGPGSRYLNFYGPTRTIQSVPYNEILATDWDPTESGLAGKMIFVGYSDEDAIEQDDEFYSAFSDDTGSSLSGVEIGAIAFSNLLYSNFIRPLPLPAHLLLVLLWGLGLTALLVGLSTRIAIASMALAGIAYFTLALTVFQTSFVWLPVVVPLLGQIPVALLGSFILKYRHAQTQSEKHRLTLGFYLPPQVVDELSREGGSNRPSTRVQYGACLATDIEEYTSLSERLSPEDLHRLLNDYYALLFSEVRRHGGFVADAVGDSMVAVWTSAEPDPATRTNACLAAIAILDAVDRFNADRTGYRLPTRIGVHSGELLLGDVGADSHFEYRAIGDIVNTASRIQDLNKQLRTSLLVSDDVLRDNDCPPVARPVGRFLLPGKSVPLSICDRVSFESSPPQHLLALIRQFGEGLDYFCARQWLAAAEVFERILARYPTDGPSQFYLELCRKYTGAEPDADWQGIIVIRGS